MSHGSTVLRLRQSVIVVHCGVGLRETSTNVPLRVPTAIAFEALLFATRGSLSSNEFIDRQSAAGLSFAEEAIMADGFTKTPQCVLKVAGGL